MSRCVTPYTVNFTVVEGKVLQEFSIYHSYIYTDYQSIYAVKAKCKLLLRKLVINIFCQLQFEWDLVTQVLHKAVIVHLLLGDLHETWKEWVLGIV